MVNMLIDGLYFLKFGVYVVFVDVLDGFYVGSYYGVSFVGVCLMFGENIVNIEIYFFDFKGDFYGV